MSALRSAPGSTFALGLVLALAATPAVAADPPVTPELGRLVEKAHGWEARGRPDKAAEVWRKILRSRPDHPTALVELGVHEARAGRTEEARRLLDRLRAAHPDHPGAGHLVNAIRVGAGFDTLLAEARQLAQAGEAADAVERYRQLFGDGPPPPALALEFYETLAGTPQGWEEARAGLADHVERHPDDVRARLALARVLTYREETRREGLRRLAQLDAEPAVADEARRSRRRALLWLHAAAEDADLFRAYLDAAGPDPEIEARLGALVEGEATGPPDLRPAYRALERGDLDRAERLFQRAARSSDREPDALVGLANVALKREDFERARKLLESVRAQAPDRPELWRRSLRTAEFWLRMQAADAARADGDVDRAAALYSEAAALSPAERLHALRALGHLWLAAGRPADAEAQFRAVLEAEPAHAGALRGLVEVLLRTGREDAALEVNARLREIAPDHARADGALQAEIRRAQAARRRAAGDLDGAGALLDEARRLDPENPWILLDRVHLHQDRGDLAAARATLDALLAAEPDLVPARVADAALRAEEGRPESGLEVLAALPDDALDDAARRLEARLEVRVAADRALRLADPRARRSALHALEERAASHPEHAAIVAGAWADLGEHERAVRLLRTVLARHPDAPAGLRLQLAALLLRAERHRELLRLLADLERDDALTARERRDLERLRVAHAVRRADRLRERGDLDRAFTYLDPLLEAHPDDPDLLTALGRLFQRAGDHREALAVCGEVLERRPEHLPARRCAVLAAAALDDRDRAEALVREGLERAPDDPRLHLLAARYWIRVADDGRAMETLERARTLAERQTPPGGDPAAAEPSTGAGSLVRMARARFAADVDGPHPAPSLQAEIRREMRAIESRHDIDFSGGAAARHRDGEEGLGALSELRTPLQLRVPLGYTGHVALDVVPVLLDAGTAAVERPDVAARFGSLGARTAGAAPAAGTEGVGLGLSYQYRGLAADVGTTPLGFPIQRFVGGVRWGHRFGPLGIAVGLARRPVRDSLLSYAGATDPATGETWGGVVRQGGRVDLSVGPDPTLYYVYGGYHVLTGTDVRTNHLVEGGVGLERTVHDGDDVKFVAGVAGSFLRYDHNLRYFTLGHGGYFSPQRFVHAGVPLILSGGEGGLSWRLRGEPGINWFREDSTPVHPDHPELQAALAEADARTTYDGRTSVAFAFDLVATLDYPFGERLRAGIRAALHTAEDYDELTAGLHLRFDFESTAPDRRPTSLP